MLLNINFPVYNGVSFFEALTMINKRPVIGITMGDPVGIGPEIILSALQDPSIYNICKPLVIGDATWLSGAAKLTSCPLRITAVQSPATCSYGHGNVNVLDISSLDPRHTFWAQPTVETGKAMVGYILTAIDMALQETISAVVTCPINKQAMHMAGYHYNGHTELLAEKTGSREYAMMLAGDKLRVVLVTIHVPLHQVPELITPQAILKTIRITRRSLTQRFGISSPRIAVAALNPHAGEGGMFGNEEHDRIVPAIRQARKEGVDITGPHPPDTVFYYALNGRYDVVVCMYHDQGLIPFKLIHFTDGVNTTLGLPIIRTSVDHGTAYDIAGKGEADPGSLISAIRMASHQAICSHGG